MSDKRIEGRIQRDGYEVEFVIGRKGIAKAVRFTSEPDDVFGPDGTVISDLMAPTVHFPFAFDVRERPYRFFAELVE